MQACTEFHAGSQDRLLSYDGSDSVTAGSGIGGGVLADDLADIVGKQERILLEAGSFVYPTHVYNSWRSSNCDWYAEAVCLRHVGNAGSSAANPIRTLVALALRLAKHLS